MNQRGQLADAWRQIKLAGDDLRSIIDLRATHVLRTNSQNNNPFDFTFDDSETRVSAALDTPLNRRLQTQQFPRGFDQLQRGYSKLDGCRRHDQA